MTKKPQPKAEKTPSTTAATSATQANMASTRAPLPERPPSAPAKSLRARRLIESLLHNSEIADRISIAENEKLRAELKERQKQLRWALGRCIHLGEKYGGPEEDKSLRLDPLKNEGGYAPSRAAESIWVKVGAGGEEEVEEEQEEQEEPEHKMPGLWVD
ncbi:hypothetical protein BZA05DRAFT_440629 [Tricharina praecox]|uniref:uncharacterized protein n=1 Tax=Tricharina praecox TaxID=43433 RepID=UPI00221F8757|nr:uncharacterized protein BZA05DRAFT_440629 [Tricharina praecox]KAI5859024.1 hypothetical protein BZA05DRAFT_440629 [Tricharina praecox]